MATPSSSGQTSYKVDSQTPGVGPDARGQFTDGYTVHFTTGLGNQGTVFIPRRDYTPERAIAAIRAHAQELDQVTQSGS